MKCAEYYVRAISIWFKFFLLKTSFNVWSRRFLCSTKRYKMRKKKQKMCFVPEHSEGRRFLYVLERGQVILIFARVEFFRVFRVLTLRLVDRQLDLSNMWMKSQWIRYKCLQIDQVVGEVDPKALSNWNFFKSIRNRISGK